MRYLITSLATCLSVVGTAQIAFTGGPLVETFNALPTASSFTNLDGQWIDNVTMLGGYRKMTTDGTPGVDNRWRIDDGNAPGGSLYDYGSFGSADRALGFVTSTNLPRIDIGLRIQNASGATVQSVAIQFVGEQWRWGTAATTSYTFSYGIGNSALDQGVFTTVPSLTVAAPHNSGAGVSLDGNAAANRVLVSGELNNLTWQPGQDLWVRWTGLDNPAGDHGLAIDDFRLTAIPEPGTWGALSLLALVRARRAKTSLPAPGQSSRS